MIIVTNFWPIYRMTHRFIGGIYLESRVRRGHSLFIGGILEFIGCILLESRVHKEAKKKKRG